MICEKCRKQLDIETTYMKDGTEMEMMFCKECKIVQEVNIDGYTLEL